MKMCSPHGTVLLHYWRRLRDLVMRQQKHVVYVDSISFLVIDYFLCLLCCLQSTLPVVNFYSDKNPPRKIDVVIQSLEKKLIVLLGMLISQKLSFYSNNLDETPCAHLLPGDYKE